MGDISRYSMPGVYPNARIVRRTVDLDYYEVVIWQEPLQAPYQANLSSSMAAMQAMGSSISASPLTLSSVSQAIQQLTDNAYSNQLYDAYTTGSNTSYIDLLRTAIGGSSNTTGGIIAEKNK